MTYEIYNNKRNELIAKADKLINEGKTNNELNSVFDEIEVLDNQYAEETKAQANLNAVKGTAIPAPFMLLENTDNTIKVGQGILSDEPVNEYENAFIKAIHGDKLTNEESQLIADVNKNVWNSETTKEHALIIPETLMSGIWQKAAEQHPILNDLTPTYIKGDVKFLYDTSEDSDADWITESDTSSDAKVSEDSILLTGCELSKAITLSWKLKKMSLDDYIPYVIDKLGKKIGNTIAKAVISGKGKPTASDNFKAQPRGIITKLKAEKGTPNVINYSGNLTYANLTHLMAMLNAAYKSGAAIYANSKTVWTVLYNLIDANNRPIFVQDVSAGGIGHIFGVPVKEEDAVSDNDVLLGNVNAGYRFNFNESMTIYQEEHIKARETDYMAYCIVDGDVISTEPFALLTPAIESFALPTPATETEQQYE